MSKSLETLPSMSPGSDNHPEDKPLHRLDSEFIVDKNPAAKREGKTVVSAEDFKEAKARILDFEKAKKAKEEARKAAPATDDTDLKKAIEEANKPQTEEKSPGFLSGIRRLFRR